MGSIRSLLVYADCSNFAAMMAAWASRWCSIIWQHSGDKIHGGGCGDVVENRCRVYPREMSLGDFERRFSGGSGDGGINGEFERGDELCPIRTVAVDVVTENLKNNSVRVFHPFEGETPWTSCTGRSLLFSVSQALSVHTSLRIADMKLGSSPAYTHLLQNQGKVSCLYTPHYCSPYNS